jgi:acetyl esterase/lipase
MMTAYLAEGENTPAIVVCPGGSYFWHDMETEGHLVAKWLQTHGISAFVLRYRTAYVPAFILRYRYIFRGNQYPDAQNDLQQAISLIRKEASANHINPHCIGAMGFSAGGHLVMSVAENAGSIDARPDFVAPIYPVVSMMESCSHKRSRRALLGERRKRSRIWQDSLSLERHVPKDCPPVFLANCVDDPIVKYQNSELLDSALSAQGIAHMYIQYQTGGHGFGASDVKGTEECRKWKEAFLKWMNETVLRY